MTVALITGVALCCGFSAILKVSTWMSRIMLVVWPALTSKRTITSSLSGGNLTVITSPPLIWAIAESMCILILV